MTTGPLFKWYGSKWLSGKKLPPPKYDTIIEPFGGGGGYSLRYSDHKVTICENDPHLFDLWKWLINDASESLILDIPISIAEGTDIRTIGLSHGQELLLKTWQRTNNVGNCWTISPWGNKPGQWTANTRARVAAEVGHIKHWQVFDDGLAILRQHTEPATWFVDPPYQYNYKYRSCLPISYAELGGLVSAKRGQIIVCEAICPKTGAIPSWLPFEFWASRITSRRKTGEHHHSSELLWTNELTD